MDVCARAHARVVRACLCRSVRVSARARVCLRAHACVYARTRLCAVSALYGKPQNRWCDRVALHAHALGPLRVYFGHHQLDHEFAVVRQPRSLHSAGTLNALALHPRLALSVDCVATWCAELQHVALRCNVSHSVATCRTALRVALLVVILIRLLARPSAISRPSSGSQLLHTTCMPRTRAPAPACMHARTHTQTGRSSVIVQHDPEPLKFERRYHIVCWYGTHEYTP